MYFSHQISASGPVLVGIRVLISCSFCFECLAHQCLIECLSILFEDHFLAESMATNSSPTKTSPNLPKFGRLPLNEYVSCLLTQNVSRTINWYTNEPKYLYNKLLNRKWDREGQYQSNSSMKRMTKKTGWKGLQCGRCWNENETEHRSHLKGKCVIIKTDSNRTHGI